MAHVFVVDERTFKVHLEYLFAGTGSRNNKSVFITNPSTNEIHHSTEKSLVGMIADISRIRVGDDIVFYVQGSGKFYGIFEATSTAFFDENDENNYLIDKLGKGLSFRIKIAPKEVYAEGITEHQYLDSLVGIEHPYQLCWSLIYRKLKGNRGCTMITDAELNSLLLKLKAKNKNSVLEGEAFTYNSEKERIEVSEYIKEYKGVTESLNIKERLIYKHNRKNAFEAHLQAYIMQNIDKTELKELLLPLPNNEEFWIGNEVSCGVGMQRIDIMTVQENDSDVFIKVIELKCIKPYESIVTEQLAWYVEWVCDYIVPNYNLNKKVHITPAVLAAQQENIEETSFYKKADKFNLQPLPNNTVLNNIEYISFEIQEDDIKFKKVF